MATDRAYLKQAQAGHFASSGAADPVAEVSLAHEETFLFTTFAAAPYVEQGFHIKKACRVKSVVLVAATTLAADATNYITATVAKRDGAGGAATTIGTRATDVAGGALTAFTPATMTLVTTAGVTSLAVGNVLTFKTADAAATTEPLITVSITVEYV
jgi:hypothetical protein